MSLPSGDCCLNLAYNAVEIIGKILPQQSTGIGELARWATRPLKIEAPTYGRPRVNKFAASCNCRKTNLVYPLL